MTATRLGCMAWLFAVSADLAIAYGFAWLTEPYDQWSTMWLAFFAIQGIALAFWIKENIVTWAWFYLKGRDGQAQIMADSLADMEYRKPEMGESRLQEYLARIMDDPTEEVSARLRAAADLGAFNGIASTGFMVALRANAIGQKAMRIYRRMTRNIS